MNIVLNIVKNGERKELRRHFGDPAEPRIFVLNGHSADYHAQTVTPFTIKSMPRGGARYRIDGRDHHLAGDAALLVNDRQHYELDFRKGGQSESFCIFYAPEIVRAAWAQSGERGCAIPEIPNLVFRPSSAFAEKLASLRAAMPSLHLSPVRLEEHLIETLMSAIATAAEHRGQSRRIAARSAAVRANLLAKLDRARSLIEAEPCALDLDALARASGLSKFHLVRLFRTVFGLPPMAYAKRVRMERAAELLKRTRRPITEIALDLGYEHLSAFTKAFQAYAGTSPMAFRVGAK